MTSLWRDLWPNYNTLDFKILTQCVKLLGERVLQVWWWYLHWFRRYRKKTRGGGLEIAPPSGARVNTRDFKMWPFKISGKNNAKMCLRTNALALARKRRFATFAGVGGGWCDPPPWRFQTKRRRASRKRPADCARRVLAIGGIIFGPRSIFDPVMAGQRSNFRKFRDFLVSRVHISKSINRSGMKPSPAYSPFNSA